MLVLNITEAVANLGFQRGGKCLLATSVHTKRGGNQVLQFCYYVKKYFGQRGDHDQIPPPPKYATAQKLENLQIGFQLNFIIISLVDFEDSLGERENHEIN